MRKSIPEILIGLVAPIVIVAGGVALVALTKRPEPEKVPAVGDAPAALLTLMPAAQTAPVLALGDSLDIEASGVVVPSREIVLAAEVAGRVVEKDQSVRPGNRVKRGHPLLKIDPQDYTFETQRVAQRLEQERVSLAENRQEIANNERLLQVAEQQLELALAETRRIEGLNKNFSSVAELDQAKRSQLTAQNQRVTLLNQLDTLKTRQQRLELGIKMAETELDQAKLNLQRTQINSPVDGIVVSEHVETDSYVQRGANLMTIEDASRMEIASSLRMEQLYWILDQAAASSDERVNSTLANLQRLPKIDAEVSFRLGGRESVVYQWKGKLDRVDGKGLDPQSRMVPVRIVIENPSEYQVNGQSAEDMSMGLVRGMFVDVVLKAKPATQLLLVPKLAVKPATDANKVWKFEASERAYELVQQRRGKTKDQPEETVTPVAITPPAIENVRSPRLEPNEWQPGILHVIDGIEVISSHVEQPSADKLEYVVCDPGRSGLAPGDQVVVSPLPNIEALEEPIRVAKSPATEN